MLSLSAQESHEQDPEETASKYYNYSDSGDTKRTESRELGHSRNYSESKRSDSMYEPGEGQGSSYGSKQQQESTSAYPSVYSDEIQDQSSSSAYPESMSTNTEDTDNVIMSNINYVTVKDVVDFYNSFIHDVTKYQISSGKFFALQALLNDRKILLDAAQKLGTAQKNIMRATEIYAAYVTATALKHMDPKKAKNKLIGDVVQFKRDLRGPGVKPVDTGKKVKNSKKNRDEVKEASSEEQKEQSRFVKTTKKPTAQSHGVAGPVNRVQPVEVE